MGTQETNEEIETLAITDGDESTPGGNNTPPAAEDRGDNFTPTEDDEDDEPAGSDTAGDGRRGGVPPERFNEVNEKRKAAEEEAARLRAENEALKAAQAAAAAQPASAQPSAPAASAPASEPAAVAVDIKALNKEAADALLEGDTERYAELQQQIMAEVDRAATERALQTINERNARSEIDAVVQRMEATYPVLASDGSGDPAAISAVIARRDSYIAQGMKTAAALEKAAGEIGALFSGTSAPSSAGSNPPADPRPAAAVRRASEVAGSQPPAPDAGIGERATTGRINVAALSDADFAKLPDSEKKRLRGD